MRSVDAPTGFLPTTIPFGAGYDTANVAVNPIGAGECTVVRIKPPSPPTLDIYPTIVSGHIQIRSTIEIDYLLINNTNGRTWRYYSRGARYDVSMLPTGFYFLRAIRPKRKNSSNMNRHRYACLVPIILLLGTGCHKTLPLPPPVHVIYPYSYQPDHPADTLSLELMRRAAFEAKRRYFVPCCGEKRSPIRR